jgi:hypothetical protein
MKRDRTFILLVGLVLTMAGCGDTSTSTGGLGTPALDPLDATPAYAVVSSDFSSSSIAMLDEGFELIDESWLNSGTTYPGLVATLSGDVVLPTRQQGTGTFSVIDRFLTDVVTQFFVPSGNLHGQARTLGETGDSGFSSNPQDIIFIDEDSAWIPRYEFNLDEDAPPENQGNDLVEINPSDWSATGMRIDLSVLNTMEMVDENTVETFARPGRGVLIGSTIVLGLDRISAAFDAAGPGAVALVDVEAESILTLEFEGLKNCGRVVPIPGEPTKAAIACVGFSNPFGDAVQIRATSGIAVIDVQTGGAAVERVWRAADDEDSVVAVNALIALDAERVLAVANGNFVDTTDTLYEIDLASGSQSPIVNSTGSFTIGTSAYDADGGRLYTPDAAVNAVIELAEDAGGFTEVGSTEIAPSLGLPPTQVYLLN